MELATARLRPPALVLFDVEMPGMDGYEICRRLKQNERPQQALEERRKALSALSGR